MGANNDIVIELYLSKLRSCCAAESFAQSAHDESLLFTISEPPCLSCRYERVLRDAHSIPLLHYVSSASGFRERVDVYRGDLGGGGPLVLTVKCSSVFSRNYDVFLAGSPLKGPPDYVLKPSTFSSSLKILQQEHVVAKAEQGFVLCGGCFQPDYKIKFFSGMDQAMVVLLVAIYDDLQPKSS